MQQWIQKKRGEYIEVMMVENLGTYLHLMEDSGEEEVILQK